MLAGRPREEYNGQLSGPQTLKSQEEEVVFKILFKPDSEGNEDA